METTTDGTWTRVCPQCKQTVEHKNKVKCRQAEKHNKVCTRCNRSNVGRANATTDTCPVCNESFKVPVAVYNNKTCELTSHAARHNMTPAQLWMLKHNVTEPPKCGCKCGLETKWISWKDGFGTFLVGHNASIYTSYDAETAKDISDKRRQKLKGQTSWAKGLTKENDERIAQRGQATSAGRRKAFKEGKASIWSKGLTKSTDARLARLSEQHAEGFRSGKYTPWAKNLTKDTDPRIAAMAMKVSIAHRTESLRKQLDSIKRLNNDEIKQKIEVNGRLRVTRIENYVNDATPAIEVECVKCNNKTFSSLRKLQNGRCFECDPGGSLTQNEIAESIQKRYNVEVRRNDRSQISGTKRHAELDIYIPSHKIAVEYNGLYWHNSLQKSDQYHENKTQQCHDLGIKLVHVFEDEWRDKRPIIESIICHALNETTTKIPARKCDIVFMSPQERAEFFNTNHIDGNTAAKVTIGLKFKDNIVAAISLRTPFHKKHRDALEVARVCTTINTVVQGGLSKLTTEAKRWAQDNGYARMISYVDTRTGGSGESWKNAGWVEIGQTPPRFWWTDNHSRFNRFKYKANKRLNMTEAQVAAAAGVVKIWGCKNLVFELVC